MDKTYKNCQSCSMPLKDKPNNHGTEADGLSSPRYCNLCYEKGALKQPDWDVKHMQDFVKGKMREMHIPGFLTGLFATGIPKLERWKNNVKKVEENA